MTSSTTAGHSRQTKFQDGWIETLNAQAWLRKGSTPSVATCTACNSDVSVAQAGIQALRQHEKGAKHIAAVAAKKTQQSIQQFFAAPKTEKVDAKSADKVTEAELRWCLHLCETNTPLHSQDHAATLFGRMFPDSQVAKNMTCGRTKLSYLLLHGLDPFFHNSLVDILRSTPFSIACDEGDGRLAILVRFVHSTDKELSPRVRLLDNVTLSSFTAESIATSISTCLEENKIPAQNCLQIMTDNCAVM